VKKNIQTMTELDENMDWLIKGIW